MLLIRHVIILLVSASFGQSQPRNPGENRSNTVAEKSIEKHSEEKSRTFQDPGNLALSGPAVTGLAVIGLTGVAVVSLIVPFIFSVFTGGYKDEKSGKDDKKGGGGGSHNGGSENGDGEEWKMPYPFLWMEDPAPQEGDRSLGRMIPSNGRSKLQDIVNGITFLLKSPISDSSHQRQEENHSNISIDCWGKIFCKMAKTDFKSNLWDISKQTVRTLLGIGTNSTISDILLQFQKSWDLGVKGKDCAKIFNSCRKTYVKD